MRIVAGLLIVLVIVWFVRTLLRGLGRRFVKHLWDNRPDVQQTAFVLQLRDLVFSNPYAYMTSLCTADGRLFVQRLWGEVGWKVARARQSTTTVDPAMDVQQFRFSDGRTIAVVCMPPTQHSHETIFIGVVLPMHPALKEDLSRAQQLVRFFILNRWGGSNRTTDLCGWTITKEQRTYNIGAPQNPQGFAGVVEAKLIELRQ
jgi:hypothetical protein